MLGLDTELLYRTFKTLSHGKTIKILFAIFFLKEEGILLIDEPTNQYLKEEVFLNIDLETRKSFILTNKNL